MISNKFMTKEEHLDYCNILVIYFQRGIEREVRFYSYANYTTYVNRLFKHTDIDRVWIVEDGICTFFQPLNPWYNTRSMLWSDVQAKRRAA